MLTERQLVILQVIIDEFIKSAHPVGSRTISEKKNISVSAATIRNVMAELESMGFLEKTHSSSGRIPSEKGYRYYVDHLISPENENNEINLIKHLIDDELFEFEQIVQMAAEVLSDLTNYTSIILGPEIVETNFKQLQIVPISSQTAVAILITNTGYVEHRTFSMPTSFEAADLEKMVNILNDRLRDVPIMNVAEVLNNEVLYLMKRYIKNVEHYFEYLKDIFLHELPIKLYVGGKANLLTQPEFNDVNKIHPFYSMMEKEDEIVNLIKRNSKGIEVTIGNENKEEAIKNFSLITASYALGENQKGTIALLGPTRMEYRKVINLLSALSNEMTNVLDFRNKKQ